MFICHFLDGNGGHFGHSGLAVWYFRWDVPVKPGYYLITASWPGYLCCHDAVVDDFGALVTVPEPFINALECHHD